MKKALITGVTGQDGAYLTQFLLNEGYEVHGLRRQSSLPNIGRFEHLALDKYLLNNSFFLHFGDMTDSLSVLKIIEAVEPDEIYNLAAQSDVAVSFTEPVYTANVNALGTLRVLEAIRQLGLEKKSRFYQASTSELYGLVQEVPQKESTPFHPRSPYAVSKLYSYWITVNYREAYGIFACNGILFNHESPIRGNQFVTRKITQALARIKLGVQDCLYLGNLDAKRDWGHAKDYVEMQWLMLQQENPDDYVISSGEQRSVKDFVDIASKILGMEIIWEGVGREMKGYWRNREGEKRKTYSKNHNSNLIIAVDPRYFRPAEVDSLIGESKKARALLRWQPRISFQELVEEMVIHDLKFAKNELFIRAYANKQEICYE